MKTECSAGQLEFHGLGRRAVVGQFDGGRISSDSGGLLLREVEQRTGILQRLAGCFVDHRNPDQIEHTVKSLVKQRVMGLALGYEDLNDHDDLRHDPLLALLSDVADPGGQQRRRRRDQGCALAGKSTLTNRLELTPLDADAASRYKKFVANSEGMDDLLVDLFLQAYDTAPAEIALDVDATDDPLHGHQEGHFFHVYGLLLLCKHFVRLRQGTVCLRVSGLISDAVMLASDPDGLFARRLPDSYTSSRAQCSKRVFPASVQPVRHLTMCAAIVVVTSSVGYYLSHNQMACLPAASCGS